MGPLKWDQFFVTPWASSEEHERKYEHLMREIKHLQLDRTSATLFTLVALFSTGDRGAADFADFGRIVALRGRYCDLLYRYLQHRHGIAEAGRLFPAFMSMLDNLKQMSDIMKNNTIKWSLSWPQVQDFIELEEPLDERAAAGVSLEEANRPQQTSFFASFAMWE